jgi:hypothetical protein
MGTVSIIAGAFILFIALAPPHNKDTAGIDALLIGIATMLLALGVRG